MKNNNRYAHLLFSLLALFSLSLAPAGPTDVVGSWRMVAHRVAPAQDGITDIYTHFKDLYGGCSDDMGLLLNADGSLKMTPVKGCQNPLGNLIMKMASKFMPSGKSSWEATAGKIVLQDGKGQRREYDLQLSGTEMQWGFNETSKQTTVRHTVVYKRD
ncbi:hypothetical protein [Spirosoma utsteinense]|uniref:Lipocalin-like domain-containing protein n=1 Tax=Spirosoma utsteinense TaxID=2585773 RepID=A0ABR6WCB8_9BACT|nr:hypothetical protein [Spirosoma utsteinense]MBC3788319.1 hypothetical protein [Spirosoma utsteinense]MBC3794225.1 hypothetical protein [Spirosoma utsteinense]